MRERATLVGGTIEIESQPGAGATVVVRIPVSPMAQEGRMNKLRILLAEDHETIRDGLKLLVNSQPDMEVIGAADNGRVAVQLAQQLQPISW